MEPVIPEISSYPTVFKPETLNRKGLCPVSTLEHEQKQEAQDTADAVLPSKHSLYFEVRRLAGLRFYLFMGFARFTETVNRKSCSLWGNVQVIPT